jgi:hypothetical protein
LAVGWGLAEFRKGPPDYHRYADNPALDTVNIFPESDDEIQIDGHGLTGSYPALDM